MVQTVIGEIYFSFSKKELKNLDKYIANSSWRASETIVKTHECLSYYTSKNKLHELDKEQIFYSVYAGDPYNDSKLRFTLNRLLSAIREFIVVSKLENDNIFTKKIWMDFLTDKKLKKNIGYNIEENVLSDINSDYKFLFQFFKSQEFNFHVFNFHQDVKKRFDSIIDVMKKAEMFSDLIFIKNYCALISLTNLYQSIPFELPMEKFNEIKSKKWEIELPEFKVYLGVIDLLLNRNQESYLNYKNALFDHFDIWNEEEKVNLIAYLLNFSTFQINRGDTSFIDELYELFQYFEMHDIFNLKNFINNTRINNVVHIYLRKKDFESAEKFVTKYVGLLDKDYKDSCRHFNMARIKFENKRYKESLRELLQVDFGKIAEYSMNSKVLLLKNYFELKESDALASLCSSFKEYMRKNKVLSENHKLSCLNFVRMAEKIYGSTSEKLNKIEQTISQSKQIAEKNWLMEKIKEKNAVN